MKAVPDFSGYFATVEGEIFSVKYGRVHKLVQIPRSDGRLRVYLRKDGKTHTLAVHKVILITFVGPCPPGMEGCHKDDDCTNNKLSNLYWGTHVKNCEDRSRNGKDSLSKLTERDVREIRELKITTNMTDEEIGNKFGLGRLAVNRITNCRTWKWVH